MDALSPAQYTLIYNLISFTVASMGAATVFFFLERGQVLRSYRTELTLAGLVTLIAFYHYLRIFMSWEAAFDFTDAGALVTTGKPFNDAYRYADWLLTVPLLVFELIAVMKLSQGRGRSLGIKLAAAAALMIALGYPGEIYRDEMALRWTFWGLSMLPFLYIVFTLSVRMADAISEQPEAVRGLVSNARWFVVVAWWFYPIVFLFPMLGVEGSVALTIEQVGYCVADIVAKVGLGLMIYAIAARKSAIEAEGGSGQVRAAA